MVVDVATPRPRVVARLVGPVFLLSSGLLLTSCGSTSTVTPPTSTTTVTSPPPTSSRGQPTAARSARDAVLGYLRAVNTRDTAAARTYLAPEYQQELASATPPFEDWVANVMSMRLRTLPPGTSSTDRKGQYLRYRDLVEFGATYDVVFRTESALDTSGLDTRFFIVGRSRTQGTWLIVSIGTGP